MEQTVNTCTKGLQIDTHPMILGTDTLSDALNATITTMNGNELILQNDMGNAKVDNAYLPPGYEPVGIKEYGGIIYVAAYNPITNKSLVGSFPSPERKISNTEDLQGQIDFDALLSYTSSTELGGIKCITTDTLLSPITNKTSLHAGDKFSIYCDGSFLENNKEKLTNYDNIDSGKVKSPKNKLYTLSVGILNSQNEFVDITKTLKRWSNTGEEVNGYKSSIIPTDNLSDLVKFNTGYFIANSAPTTSNSGTGSKNDRELLLERLKMAINTYSYKLIGPMYIKTVLNHPTNFNYNIYGIYDKTKKKATLWIEGTISYNCPDGIFNTGTDIGDSDYKSYDEGKVNLNFFDLYVKNNENLYQKQKAPNSKLYYTSTCEYNKSTNLYTIKQTLECTEITPTQGDILEYVIGVKAILDTNEIITSSSTEPSTKPSSAEDNTLYLQNLSVAGTLDLSKLGSGTISLKGWRFYNTDNRTILTYTLDAYPKYGEKFDDLLITFTDTDDDKNKVIYPNNTIVLEAVKVPKPKLVWQGDELKTIWDTAIEYKEVESDYKILEVNNGRTTLYLDWLEIGLEPLKLYKVGITYKSISTLTNNSENTESNTGRSSLITEYTEDTEDTEDTDYYWLLTTPLFNEHYAPDEKYFIPNFCTVKNLTNASDSVKEFFKKMEVSVNVNHNVTDSSYSGDTTIEDKLVYSQPSSTSTENQEDLNLTSSNSELTTSSDLTTTTYSKLTYEQVLNVDIQDSPSLAIANPELYPYKLSLNDTSNVILEKVLLERINDWFLPESIVSNIELSTSTESSTLPYEPLQEYILNNNYIVSNNLNLSDSSLDDYITYNIKESYKNRYKAEFKFKDQFIAESKEHTEDVENVFAPISHTVNDGKTILDLIIPSTKYSFGGVTLWLLDATSWLLDLDQRTKEHILAYVNTTKGIPQTMMEATEPKKSDSSKEEIFQYTIPGTIKYGGLDESLKKFRDYAEQIYNLWNKTDKKLMFLYGFPSGINYSANYLSLSPNDPRKKSGLEYARVWWRTADKLWAMLNDFFCNTEPDDFKTWLTNNLFNGENFVYCAYPKNKIDNLYVPDTSKYIYNNLYNLTLYYYFYYTKKNKTINLTNSYKYGNFKLVAQLTISDSLEWKVILNSSYDFLDYVNTLLVNGLDLKNIYIDGIRLDSKGNVLDPSKVYYYKNDKLYLISNKYNKFSIDLLNPVIVANSISIYPILYGGSMTESLELNIVPGVIHDRTADSTYERPERTGTGRTTEESTTNSSTTDGRSGLARDTVEYSDEVQDNSTHIDRGAAGYYDFKNSIAGAMGLSYDFVNIVDILTPLKLLDGSTVKESINNNEIPANNSETPNNENNGNDTD